MAKDQEITFLRETIKLLLVKKEQETAIYPPTYIDNLGQTVSLDMTNINDNMLEGVEPI